MASLGDIITGANAQYGLPKGYLGTVAGIESSWNPNASNPSGAKGLFQFVPSTAAHYGLSNPYDPSAASAAAGQFTRDNYNTLAHALGHAPSAEQLYLAHQQGAGGAAGLLTHPNAPAASIVGASAVTNNGGTADMTSQQFADLWGRKYDKRAGLPVFAAAAGAGQQQAGTPGGANIAGTGSAPEGVYANAPSSTPQGDGGVALAAALAPSAQDQQQSQIASLYAQQTAAQQQAAQAQRTALLSSGKVAPTQQIG